MMIKTNKRKAFTIIETLIVLLLASILIAGVFFAKKMIRENNVKALVMQIKKYDAAVNAFTQKYHALPGDINDTTTYGITPNNTGGNGDNIITDRAKSYLSANHEISNFWMHLSKSKMLDEEYDGKEDEEVTLGRTFPVSKLGEKVGIIAFGFEDKTFYQVGFEFSNVDRIYTKNRALKTDEAFLFDKKIDDGNPKKGRVVAAGGDALNILANSECVHFDEYNQKNVSPVCQLRIEVR
jgi:type II secretory pathway pseudopilin PulG